MKEEDKCRWPRICQRANFDGYYPNGKAILLEGIAEPCGLRVQQSDFSLPRFTTGEQFLEFKGHKTSEDLEDLYGISAESPAS